MKVVGRRRRRRPGAEGGPHLESRPGCCSHFLTDLNHLTLMFTDSISVDDLNSWPRRYQR